MLNKQTIYQASELTSSLEVKSQPHQLTFSSRLNKILHSLMDALIEKTEPRVLQKCDRMGHIWWYVYDPVTGKSACFPSEAEAATWIEQRYYC